MDENYNYYLYNNPFLSLYYNNQKIESRIPEKSFNLEFLHKLFSPDNLSKVITNDKKNYLKTLLPKDVSCIIK